MHEILQNFHHSAAIQLNNGTQASSKAYKQKEIFFKWKF